MLSRESLLIVWVFMTGIFTNMLLAEELVVNEGFAKEEPIKEETKNVGRFFDAEVSLENYIFVKGGLIVFGNRFGAQPQNEEELAQCIWDQLLLSYEAYRRGIVVNQDEIEKEVQKILQAEKAAFDFKKDKTSYEQWAKQKVNAAPVFFENLLYHNLQIQKLRQQILDVITPVVSEKEAKQEFLNERNSVSVELVEFEERKEAEKFYAQARKDAKFWDKEKKGKAKEFRRPGFVALEFLIDIWMFPKDAVYKMMKQKAGSVYQPIPIYNGFGVCKVLETRPADEDEFTRLRDSYYSQVRQKKKNDGFGEWFKNLKKQANIIIYSR